MGHKVNPKGFRMGVLYTWDSKWFARGKDFRDSLQSDLEIKKFLRTELKRAGVAKIEIERTRNAVNVILHTGSPGMVIGRGGAGAEDLKKKLRQKFFGSQKMQLNLTIVEVQKSGMNAELVVQSIASEIERRVPFRRVMKQSIERVQKAGALGVKVTVSGRLNGAEIARTETLSQGKIPLHTLRANIDYSRGVARTIYGAIGIKVWVYKGEVFEEKEEPVSK